MFRILAVNPGSTSTKIAVYEDEKEIFRKTFEHSAEKIEAFDALMDQLPYRTGLITACLKENDIPLDTLSCIVGRGGMLPPVKAGGYLINEAMKTCLIQHPKMIHASNLGALIADEIAKPLSIPAYIYDAVVSDEMLPEAHITGFPEIGRQSFCHVLNSKAAARKAAESQNKKYEDMNFVVAHMGGGISISAHQKGRIIDSVSDDAGPFSPDRSGSVNLMYLVDLCYSKKYKKEEVLKKVRGQGGMKAYLGTHDCKKIEEMIQKGDKCAELIYRAEGLQISKGIGIMLGVFDEPLDGIILTGGMAYSDRLTGMIKKRLEHLLPVVVMPGEFEMEALALGGLRILRKEETVNIFSYKQ